MLRFHPSKAAARAYPLLTFFGTIADSDIIKPVNAAIISGKIKASEVLSGFFMSNRITIKNALVANVDEEYTSFILY